jgi:hypothetical protein
MDRCMDGWSKAEKYECITLVDVARRQLQR